jgi:hypothetical protein
VNAESQCANDGEIFFHELLRGLMRRLLRVSKVVSG